FRIERALTDLAEPDSPTKARHSPRLISNEMRSSATEFLPSGWKTTERSRTLSSGWLMASMRSSRKRLAWIERVAHGLADEDQEREHDRDREEAGKAEPRRLDVGLGLREQFTERRRARRQAEAEEVQRGQRHHG